jgi:hypothetical protein
MRAKVREVKISLIEHRDLPIPDQARWLASVLRGHCNYYAVPDNTSRSARSANCSSDPGSRRCGAAASDPG